MALQLEEEVQCLSNIIFLAKQSATGIHFLTLQLITRVGT